MRFALLPTILFLFALATSTRASGTLSGQIISADDGTPVTGAEVVISDLRLGTSSDRQGNFRLPDIPDGNHNVQVSHIAYYPLTVRKLPVSAYQQPHLLLELEPRIWSGDTLQVNAAAAGYQLVRGRPQYRQQLPQTADQATLLRKLQEIPGLRLLEGSGEGTVVSIDGCPAEQVLICIDGVPLNPGGSSAVDLSTLQLSDAGRVEVTRGSGQTLFSATGGGVVNFITTDEATGIGGFVALSSRPSVAAGLEGERSSWNYSFTGSHDSGTYPYPDPTGDNLLTRQENNDRQQLAAAVNRKVGNWSLRAAGGLSERGLPKLLDEPGDRELRQHDQQLKLHAGWYRSTHLISCYLNVNRNSYTASPTAGLPLEIDNDYLQLDSGIGWELRLSGGELFLSLVDNQYRFQDETGAVPDSRGSRQVLRCGGSLALPSFDNFPELEVQAGGAAVLTPEYRLDPFIGLHTVSRLGEGQFHLGVEQGLHYPSFATQFPLEALQVRGNPDLRPERFLDLRAGWLQTGQKVNWQLEYSRKLAIDLIRWQRGNGNIYRPVNLDRALIQSLTGYLRWQITPAINCSGSLQLLDPRNRTAGDINEGRILPLRQLLAGYLRLAREKGDYFCDLTLQYGSRQYTLASNTSSLSLGFREIAPYTVTSFTLGRKLEKLEVVVRIDNLFNQDLQRLERRVEPLRTFSFSLQRSI